MARFTLACSALLSILGIAAAVPLTAQETGPTLAQACPTCPPSPAPSYEYPATPGEYYMPGPSMDEMPIEPRPMDMTPSDSGSMSNVPPSPGQSFDGSQQPFDAAQMPDLNTQAPDMATPTFNPSSAPTTAATSPESVAPNMIGDLFGTTFAGSVPVLIDRFYAFPDLAMPPLLGPDIDPLSPFALTVSSMAPDPDLIIAGAPGGTPIDTIDMFALTFSTVDSQADIAAANPLLDGAVVPIVNNPLVQDEVDMVGDALHGPGTTVFRPEESNVEIGGILGPEDEYDPIFAYDFFVLSEVAGLSNPGGAPGANVGRQKISENTSPLPRDRVFVNYSYFKNTPLTSAGVNVNRVTPGFEKTFFGGDMSIEVRAPFATTLDSDMLSGGLSDTSSVEFGNLTVYLKALLWDAGYEAISAGVGVSLPTADDLTLGNILEIENESVHILPFIGALFLPTERMYIQGFLQADIDPNGNTLRYTDFDNGIPTGTLLTAGRPNDADYIFFSMGLGYWIYQAPLCGSCGDCSGGSCGGGSGWIRGIAPTLELHFNGTFNDADTLIVQRGAAAIPIGESSTLNLWNMVLGVNFELRNNATLTLGYATPVSGKNRAQFDSEFRATFNWYFGGPDRVHTCCF